MKDYYATYDNINYKILCMATQTFAHEKSYAQAFAYDNSMQKFVLSYAAQQPLLCFSCRSIGFGSNIDCIAWTDYVMMCM